MAREPPTKGRQGMSLLKKVSEWCFVCAPVEVDGFLSLMAPENGLKGLRRCLS